MSIAMLVGPAAFAQNDEPILEEVLVTAQKREEPLQQVPVSVLAINGDRIEEMAHFRLSEVQDQTPNFVTTETALGSNISMRGIFSGANQGFEQSVGIYADGIYRGRSQQSRAPFFDLERIEILRGSQNTLFGHNSVAGALNLTSARPTDFLTGRVSVLYEPDLDQRNLTAIVSGPLTDSFSGRLAILSRSRDGHMENLTIGGTEPREDDLLLRGTLAWQPSDRLDVRLKLEASEFDVDGRAIEVISDQPAQAGPFAGLNYAQILVGLGQDMSVLNTVQDYARSANGDFSRNETAEAVVSVEYAFDSLTLTSITGHSSYEFDEVCDCDFTGGNVFKVPQNEEFDQFSQEIRLTSGSGGRREFIAGLYYQKADLQFFDTLAIDSQSVIVPIVNALTQSNNGQYLGDTGTPRFFDQEATTWSAFGQATWRLADQLRFTAGMRVSSENKEASRVLNITDINFDPLEEPAATIAPLLYAGLFNVRTHAVSGERSETLYMPSVSVQRDFGNTSMGYVTLRRGAKSGGFDPRSNNPISAGGGFEFEDEHAINFELGIKHTIGRGGAEVNIAYYRTDIRDLQVSTYDGTLGYNVTNAGEALTQGIEVDARWAATRSLVVNGSLAISDFEFEDYIGQCYFGQMPDAPDGINCNYAGKTNQFVPDYRASLSADYIRPISSNLVFRALVTAMVSDSFFRAPTLDPAQVQDSYGMLDARLSIGELDNKWELALIGRNLTDEVVIGYSIDVPLAGANFGTPGVWGLVDRPRTVALQGTVRF